MQVAQPTPLYARTAHEQAKAVAALQARGRRLHYYREMRVAVLFLPVASTIFAGAKRLVETGRLAFELARVDDLEARRATLFGPWYVAVQQLRREIPGDATVEFERTRSPRSEGDVSLSADCLPAKAKRQSCRHWRDDPGAEQSSLRRMGDQRQLPFTVRR